MKLIFTLTLCGAILQQTSFAQANFKVSSFNPTPQAFKYLLLTNKEIADNDTINEKILDLVNPMVIDSVITKPKQHHRVFLVGWLIHAFGGYNWRAVDMHKQKTVGTVMHDGRSGEVEFSEYDIKFHLQFHLRKYLNQICTACDLQKKFHRQDIRRSHRTNYEEGPFVRDTNNIDGKLYDLGTELTPPIAFLPQLNYLFFPTLPEGGGLKEHPNFGTKHPSMVFYGVSCLDCNHNCHPEMHPYEWTWWLNLRQEELTGREWLIGLFHESSNRFPDWSKNPKTGEISIPFAYYIGNDEPRHPSIKIEHLVFNRFRDKEMDKLGVPANAFGATELQQESITIEAPDSSIIDMPISFNEKINTTALKYWLSDLNLDDKNHILSGYFHLATSIEDLYTTRITFDYQYEFGVGGLH